jgi:hypothetical protein
MAKINHLAVKLKGSSVVVELVMVTAMPDVSGLR